MISGIASRSDVGDAVIGAKDQGQRRGKKAGSVWMTLGILLFVAAAGLSAYNYYDGMRAAIASTKIAEELSDRIVANILSPSGDAEKETNTDENISSGESEATGEKTTYTSSASEGAIKKYGTRVNLVTAAPYEEMPTEVIDGEKYIGILEIPSLDLTLPVMENWDYDRLKISPCRYSGSYYSDDLVICAHNYARHFSPIKWIGIGVDVCFTNVNGLRMKYKTSNIVTVGPTSVDEMINNTSGDANNKKQWDLTLFTCNTGGQTRCAVRCVRVQE